MSILQGIYAAIPFDTADIRQSDLNISKKYRSNPLRWKGQFSPQFVQVLLDKYSNPNSVVFDPFVGSGTVLYEAGLLGLAACGTEINPAAAMLAQTYRFINMPLNLRYSLLQETSVILQNEFQQEMQFYKSLDSHHEKLDIAMIKQKLVGLISKVDDRYLQGLLETLITLLDFYQPDLSVDKVFKAWFKLKGHITKLPFSNQPIDVFLADARRTPLVDSSIDLVVTSPPYINVFNYHQQYRASMEALDWNLLEVSRSEFGSNRKHRSNRFLTVIQYCLDISQTFEELARVCRNSAKLIFIVGRESMVNGTRFFNGEIVAEIAHRIMGFDLLLKQQRSYRNNFGQSIFEDILHFSPTVSDYASYNYLDDVRRLSEEVLEATYANVPEKSKSALQQALKDISKIHPSPFFDTLKMRKA